LKLNWSCIKDKLCICSLKSQVSSFDFRSVCWPTSDFNCPMKMESASVGAIFLVEFVRHFRIIHWLCGFTKYCQQVSHFNLVNFLIGSTFSSAFCLQLVYSCCVFGRNLGAVSDIRLALYRFSLTQSMILLAAVIASSTACYAFLICASHLLNNISLWDSLILGNLALLPSSDSYQFK